MSKSQLYMLIAATLIVCGGAYVHGMKTDRWGQPTNEKLSAFTDRLHYVPIQFGDWTSEPVDIPADEFKASNCDGGFQRVYTNSVTGDQISIFLVSGRGYHCTIHTPDFCYTAAGFQMARDPVNFSFEIANSPEPMEIIHTVFNKEETTITRHLRILWTYTNSGVWKSPSMAKYEYGDEDAMYKMYIVRNVEGRSPLIGEEPGVAFCKEFIPLVNQALFAPEVPWERTNELQSKAGA